MDPGLARFLEVVTPYEGAQVLLAETGLSDISHTLLAGTIGLAIQALVTGSVLQLVHRYFRRQARAAAFGAGLDAQDVHGSKRHGGQDPPLARAGVIWLTALICLHVVVVNIINARVVLMSAQFTAGYLMDFWLAQISNLIFAIVLLPVFLFFAFRVWNLWSRRKVVLGACILAVMPAVGLGIVAAFFGLQHPYPLVEIDNSAFAAWLPFVTMTIKKLQWIAVASSTAQFAAALLFSALICIGLFQHRQCCTIMPGFTGKIAFVVGESLFPLVFVSAAILVGDVMTAKQNTYVGPLITRGAHSCAPAIYFHCLMNSLASAQRQRNALRSTIEHMAEEGFQEKGDMYDHSHQQEVDEAFNPKYHPEELDTPLQVNIHHGGGKKGRRSYFPQIITSSPSNLTGGSETASHPTTPGPPSRSSSFIRSPFRAMQRKLSGDNGDNHLRSAGTGRRSSLAHAAGSSTGDLTVGGLSIKLQNKLPVVSFNPGMNRRESESIFVAHEEFEGLPRTPGDVLGVQLGDIEEGEDVASGRGTPVLRALTPTPAGKISPLPPSQEWEVTSPKSGSEMQVERV